MACEPFIVSVADRVEALLAIGGVGLAPVDRAREPGLGDGGAQMVLMREGRDAAAQAGDGRLNSTYLLSGFLGND